MKTSFKTETKMISFDNRIILVFVDIFSLVFLLDRFLVPCDFTESERLCKGQMLFLFLFHAI